MKKPPKKPVKKPYVPPKLIVYGNLTEMTKAAGEKGTPDGGTAPNRRTGA